MLQLPGSSLELCEQFSTMFQGWWIENISVLVFTTFSERLSTRRPTRAQDRRHASGEIRKTWST